jgi:hypothetical protein
VVPRSVVLTGENGDQMGTTFYASLAAASFGFLVYYLKSARPDTAVKAGAHAACLVIWLYLLVKAMIA